MFVRVFLKMQKSNCKKSLILGNMDFNLGNSEIGYVVAKI